MNVSLACKMLDALGFITQQVGFERVVEDQSFRELLTTGYLQSPATRLLLHMPDIFALHKMADPKYAGLFVTVLSADQEPDVDTWYAYRTYYPPQVALMRFSPDSRTTRVTARWSSERPNSERPLVPFLVDAGIAQLPGNALEVMQQLGLEVT